MAKGKKTGGRQKGSVNKENRALKEALSFFIEDNIGRMQELFDRVAEQSPAQAISIFKDLIEYRLPKLARVEHEGEQQTTIIQIDSSDAKL